VVAEAESKRSCGLVCPSEVEEFAEAARSRKSIYDFYGLRVEFGGDGSAWFEIVDEKKRLGAHLDSLMVDELYRAMLDEAGVKLFGTERPTMTAIYTIKALMDAAAEWLRAAEAKRRRIAGQLKKAEAAHTEYIELEKMIERLKEEYNKTKDKKIWIQKIKLERKLQDLKITDEEIGYGMEPHEAVKRYKKALAEAEETERRIRIAALALAHAWRALTHPTIDDLEQLYGIPSDGDGPLDHYVAKARTAEVVE